MPARRIGSPLWDAVERIAQAVRVPGRRRAGAGAYVVEWLDDGQVEPLRTVLEPVVTEALRRIPGRAARASGGPLPVSERAVFELLGDVLELPEVDIDDTVWSFEPDDGRRFDLWSKIVFTPEAGFAARVGDVMLHGDPVAPGLGSPNVLIGGRPALRSCDSHVCTRAEAEPHAGTGFVATCTTVEINGFPALRVGDYVDEGPHGLNAIVTGCPSVVLGPTPPPGEGWRTDGAKPVRQPAEHQFSWHRGEVGPRERKEVLGVELDGPRVRAEGKARAVRLWAEATQEDTRR